jgi:hypothetical protein
LVGAVLIKNYSSFEKHVKKVPPVFLKISSYQSTPQNPSVRLSASSPPPSLILLNAIFIKIIPPGKEFAMMIPHSHGVGNVVAQGS